MHRQKRRRRRPRQCKRSRKARTDARAEGNGMTEPSGDLNRALAGRVIALPEARQLDVLANLVEKRGATVLRCPLVGIHDASDQAPIVAWIKRRIAMPSDDLIIFYTGEGIERLMAAARRAGIEGDFHGALRRTRKLTRGP